MFLTRSRLAAVVSTCALLAGGCSDGPKLAPVKGTVTLDGKPLQTGTVTFEMAGVRPATARIEKGQIVEATTFAANDGVPVGSHRVAVAATEDAASAVVANPGDKAAPKGNYMGGKSLIPAAYNDPATSKLTAEIGKGDNTVKLELFSSGPK